MKFATDGKIFVIFADLSQSPCWGTKIALKTAMTASGHKPGLHFRSNHLKGNKTASVLHIATVILVMLQSPITVFPSATVALMKHQTMVRTSHL